MGIINSCRYWKEQACHHQTSRCSRQRPPWRESTFQDRAAPSTCNPLHTLRTGPFCKTLASFQPVEMPLAKKTNTRSSWRSCRDCSMQLIVSLEVDLEDLVDFLEVAMVGPLATWWMGQQMP